MAARTTSSLLGRPVPGSFVLAQGMLAFPMLAFPTIALTILALAASPGYAGDVTGRVQLPPSPVKASFSPPALLEGLGAGAGAGAGAGSSAAVAGPVLVYVAEAAAPLPRAKTTGAHLSLTSGATTAPLVALALGSTLVIENADDREHRLVARGGSQSIDLGLLARGRTCKLTARETGVLSLVCTLHKEAAGEIVVLAHAAFTFADANGGYRLAGLPPGLATVVAYSPRCGEVSREVTVPASGEIEVGFKF